MLSRLLLIILCAVSLVGAAAPAKETADAAAPKIIAPNPQLRAEGIPPIDAALAAGVDSYTEFRGHRFLDWHPQRAEMLVSHRAEGANTTQLFLLRAPGGALEPLTDFAEPIRSGLFDPVAGRFIVYPRDAGGNEAARIYRLDLDSRRHTLLSDPNERSDFTFNHAGDRLLIASLPLDRTAPGGRREQIATTLWLVDPLQPDERRKLAELPGGGWSDFRFSPDDKTLVYINYRSATDTEVWAMEVAGGKTRRLLPAQPNMRASYSGFDFSADGKTLFLTTDERSEFMQLAAYDLANGDLAAGTLRVLSAHIGWDIERFAVSDDGKQLAAVANEDGVDRLHLFDAVRGVETRIVALPAGGIGGLRWHRTRRNDLGLSSSSPRSPGEIYAIDAADGTATRWTTAAARIDLNGLAEPQIVRWKSFDGRMISGILYLPPARFQGPRPVLVNLHGGPEAQATVGFLGRYNYLLNTLGVALLAPNVRGSRGYGKTFVDLDNGVKREDSVKDVGAMLDWIATDARLDAKRVMVSGGSYGGYMVLASLVHFSERLRGGIDVVGISDFVTFLTRTESYRRDLRRAEYGDERDPATRAVLERISPLANAGKIRTPLFVVHGRNDPRVPYTEAEQIVARVRGNGVPVWYLLADNEGHGFARKANVDYLQYATIKFIEQVLLAP